MTAKRFWKFIPDTCNPYGVVIRIVDNETCRQHGTVDEYVDLLNELHEEKERWKFMSVTTSNENEILWNEVHILMEQGAEPSDAFKKYLESISTEHTKFWQRKLEKAKKDGVIE